jgi:hypothetical protein
MTDTWLNKQDRKLHDKKKKKFKKYGKYGKNNYKLIKRKGAI